MTWEEWQENFWKEEWEVKKERVLYIEGAGVVNFYRGPRSLCKGIKDQLEEDGVEGLEIIDPNMRGNDGGNCLLIQNPNKIGPQIQYQNLLD